MRALLSRLSRFRSDAPATRSEEGIITLLKESGLDWRTSLGTLADRHGVQQHPDFDAVIELPAVTTLTRSPVNLLVRYNERIRDIIPTYAFCYLAPFEDAERNHTEVVSELRRVLGKGAPGTAVNTLHEEWVYGAITVAVTTWPSTLQRDKLPNLLHARNPRLKIASLVTVRSLRGHIFPSPELANLFDRTTIHLFKTAGAPDGIFRLPSRAAGFGPKIMSTRYERTNPVELDRRLPDGSWCVWRDDAWECFGVSIRTHTLLIPRQHIASLLLTRYLPARGSGGAELAMIEHPALQAPDAQRGSVTFLSGHTPESLDALTAELALFFKLPWSSHDALDD